LEDEQREVRYWTFSPQQFTDSSIIDEKSVQAYYKDNVSRFMTQESVRLSYAEQRVEQLATQTTLSEAELREAYQKNTNRYVQPEKRRARHVLLKTDTPDALKQAEKVAVLARQPGADFAALAKQYSTDTGSQSQGGDLGWAERSTFVGPFADALFAMQPGEIRGPVKTEFGLHIIKLEEIQAGKTREFAEVRDEIDSELRQQRAVDKLGELQELLTNRIEQTTADWSTLIREFQLQSGEVTEFFRTTGGAPLGDSNELRDLVFSAPVLNDNRVGGPLALGEDRIVIVKVVQHRKPAAKPLATVREEILNTLRAERNTQAARKAAEQFRTDLIAGKASDAAAQAAKVEQAEPARYIGRATAEVAPALRTAIFEAPKPATGKPIYRTVALDEGSFAVVAVTGIKREPHQAAGAERQQRVAGIAARNGSNDVAAYIEQIRNAASVSKNPEVFAQ
jgi:peptidyl-prolyl cis-trans isomerase D